MTTPRFKKPRTFNNNHLTITIFMWRSKDRWNNRYLLSTSNRWNNIIYFNTFRPKRTDGDSLSSCPDTILLLNRLIDSKWFWLLFWLLLLLTHLLGLDSETRQYIVNIKICIGVQRDPGDPLKTPTAAVNIERSELFVRRWTNARNNGTRWKYY